MRTNRPSHLRGRDRERHEVRAFCRPMGLPGAPLSGERSSPGGLVRGPSIAHVPWSHTHYMNGSMKSSPLRLAYPVALALSRDLDTHVAAAWPFQRAGGARVICHAIMRRFEERRARLRAPGRHGELPLEGRAKRPRRPARRLASVAGFCWPPQARWSVRRRRRSPVTAAASSASEITISATAAPARRRRARRSGRRRTQRTRGRRRARAHRTRRGRGVGGRAAWSTSSAQAAPAGKPRNVKTPQCRRLRYRWGGTRRTQEPTWSGFSRCQGCRSRLAVPRNAPAPSGLPSAGTRLGAMLSRLLPRDLGSVRPG